MANLLIGTLIGFGLFVFIVYLWVRWQMGQPPRGWK